MSLLEQQTISDLNITFSSTLFSCLLFMLPRSHAVYCRAFWLDHIFTIHSGFITGAVKSNVWSLPLGHKVQRRLGSNAVLWTTGHSSLKKIRDGCENGAWCEIRGTKLLTLLHFSVGGREFSPFDTCKNTGGHGKALYRCLIVMNLKCQAFWICH